MERQYLLEQIDDAAVVQLYADGFAALLLNEKMLIWHLSQAALAGRDIYWDQRYRHNLEMRGYLEAIVRAGRKDPGAFDPDTLAEIRRYTKLFWINSGPYNNLTARKFVLKCSFEAFTAAVSAGQYRHPTGVFYGGTGPVWSHRWLREWSAARLDGVQRLGSFDSGIRGSQGSRLEHGKLIEFIQRRVIYKNLHRFWLIAQLIIYFSPDFIYLNPGHLNFIFLQM